MAYTIKNLKNLIANLDSSTTRKEYDRNPIITGKSIIIILNKLDEILKKILISNRNDCDLVPTDALSEIKKMLKTELSNIRSVIDKAPKMEKNIFLCKVYASKDIKIRYYDVKNILPDDIALTIEDLPVLL